MDKLQMNRNNILDIVKAIGIILVVIGHSGSPIREQIYLFHVPMFFIIAGYVYNDKYSKSYQNLIKLILNKIKKLYIPCVIFNIITVILHNFFIERYMIGGDKYSVEQIFTNIAKCFLFAGAEEFGSAMWFLRTMFVAVILYACMDYICQKYFDSNKEMVKTILSVTMLLTGWKGAILPGGKYLNVLVVILLIQIGYWAKLNNVIKKTESIWRGVIKVMFFAIGIAVLSRYGRIELVDNYIENPVYFLAGAIMGTAMCVEVAGVVENYKWSKLLCTIGKNTLPIMMLHFVAMKFITWIQIQVYDENLDKLVAHPYLYNQNGWWIVYSVGGVVFPLIVYAIWKVIIVKIGMYKPITKNRKSIV